MRRSTGSTSSTAPTISAAAPEDAVAERAVAEGRDAARLGHRRVGGQERGPHPGRHGPRDEQDVGVPGRRDDPEPEPRHVDVRPRDKRELVLAAVARAAVDVADRERAGAVAAGSADRAAELA